MGPTRARRCNIAGCGRGGLEDGGGEGSKGRVTDGYVPDRLVKVAQEGLEIGKSRTAIDPVHLAINLKLPCMTCGASYSDGLESPWARRVEAYGEVCQIVRIRQEAVSGQIIRQERLAVLPFQRLQPREIDQARALI